MKYEKVKLNNLLFNDNYVIFDYHENEDIHLYIKSKNSTCKCPNCKAECNIHSTYKRVIQDTPIHNKTTWLHVSAYEYECLNQESW